jgi:MFS family permease
MVKVPPKEASYVPPKGVKVREYSKIIPLAILAGAIYGTLFNFISHYAAIVKLTYISIFAQTHITVMLIMRLSFHDKLDTWRRDKVIITSYIFAFFCLFFAFLLKYIPFIPMLMLIGGFYGVVQGLLFPSLNALFIETTPFRSGKATIIFVVSRNIGIAVFAFICGFLAQKLGYHMMYLIISGVVACVIVYVIVKRKEILGVKTS